MNNTDKITALARRPLRAGLARALANAAANFSVNSNAQIASVFDTLDAGETYDTDAGRDIYNIVRANCPRIFSEAGE